jgi:LPS-assembly protein
MMIKLTHNDDSQQTARYLALMCLCLIVDPLSAIDTNTTPSNIAFNQLSPAEQGQQLGWQSQAEDDTTWCPGHFPISNDIKDQGPQHDPAITITAKHSATLQEDGVSSIKGGVQIQQGKRHLSADQASLYRNHQGDIQRIVLEGNVHFREQDKLIIANELDYDLTTDTGQAHDIIYRIRRRADSKQVAWGSGKKVKVIKHQYYRLYAANYSTCPPTKMGWRLHSQRISLNTASGRGQAQNAWLSIGKLPVFYFPYIDFPLDKRRKSGFLTPHYAHSSVNGSMVSLPIYWNIAPNYDATITPQYIEKRGAESAIQFRQMDRHGHSAIKWHWMPEDKLFNDFKTTARTTYAGSNDHFFRDIDRASKQRYFVHLDDDRQWGSHLHTSLDINRASDAYQFQDLNFSDFNEDVNQLSNQLTANYNTDHWKTSMLVSSYQTLHQVNSQGVEDQYQQLPAITIDGAFPSTKSWNISAKGGVTQFDKSRDYLTDSKPVTGWRYHAQPTLHKTLTTEPIEFSTSLGLSSTEYQLQHQTAGVDAQQRRNLPIFTMDAQSTLDKTTNLFGQHYRQTLEPHLHYLYVPYKNQDSIPDFDTDIPAFSTDMITSNNRFTGMDRIGDANHIGISLSTRLLTPDTLDQKFIGTIGGIVYFSDRKVCLTSACDNDNEQSRTDTLSPFAASANYALNEHWDIDFDAAFEPNEQHLQNSHATFAYHRDDFHLMSLSYEYLRGGDPHPDAGVNNNLYRIKANTYWPISHHWQGIGHWHYNLSHHYLEDYFIGTEYQSCCWALRVMLNRTLLNENTSGNTTYNNQLQLQIALKGLTSFQYNHPHHQLVDQINNFNDHLGDYR